MILSKTIADILYKIRGTKRSLLQFIIYSFTLLSEVFSLQLLHNRRDTLNMRSITLSDIIRRVDMWELLVLALKRNLQKR